MTNSNLRQITLFLTNISKMLGFLIVKDLETVKDKVIRLYRVGLSPKDISEILGVTPNHVNVTLTNARNAGEIT